MAAIADHAPGAARTVRDDRVWALLPADADGAGLATALHERLGVAAAAVASSDGAPLRFALDVAALAAALVADGAVSPASAARGTWRLLLRDAVRAPEDVRALAAALGPLLDDRTPQAAEQRRTLATYLANDCNMNATAAAMPAHRHTVAYRLERIRELTGLDPLRAEDREQLGIALKARAVAKVTPGPPQ
jgi:DNA-binding PucR family transcriptional regulator